MRIAVDRGDGGQRSELGTDTLVVLDGKIVAQSFAAKISPKG